MRCTPREAQARVRSDEFTEQRAFWLLCPSPEDRLDLATRLICLCQGGDADVLDKALDHAAPYRELQSVHDLDHAAIAEAVKRAFGAVASCELPDE